MPPISSPQRTESNLQAVLCRERPDRIVYAPNYWQWFAHNQRNGLPHEVRHCPSQLDLLRQMRLDVFSRNVYCDQETCWFGGLTDAVYEAVECDETETRVGPDRVFERYYRTRKGDLSERLRYVTDQSTLVQEKFLVEDVEREIDAFEELVQARRWRFRKERYRAIEARAGDGCIIAGELYSPLKLLHFAMNPARTSYFLADEPDRAAAIMAEHETAMLDLARQIASAGVPAMMSMDNLDTLFHPPKLVERCSASFYEKAAAICHDQGSLFFIHACGKQKANLKLIGSLGVDGLEGVAFPTLGDVELDEAMRLSGDRLIVTGGVSAMEFERLTTPVEVFAYVEGLFERMRPYAHRFIFSSSCNTPCTARWETMRDFRDAWLEFRVC
ncbi:MAG: uroporphyrinogen decarboxylase family protein [Bryobacteraceae bacterium]